MKAECLVPLLMFMVCTSIVGLSIAIISITTPALEPVTPTYMTDAEAIQPGNYWPLLICGTTFLHGSFPDWAKWSCVFEFFILSGDAEKISTFRHFNSILWTSIVVFAFLFRDDFENVLYLIMLVKCAFNLYWGLAYS